MTDSTAAPEPTALVPVVSEVAPRSMTPEQSKFSVLVRMAKAITASGLFGIKTEAQAVALMLIAEAEGRHPALAARDYDIIQGRPAKKAEAMLRDFLGAGGKVEWHELSDTKADATFSHVQGGSVRIVWDLERVKKAQISNEQMYRKYPRQMLRSRTVSEGVRTIWPAATSGMYEPDEVRGFVEEPTRLSSGAASAPSSAGSDKLGGVSVSAALPPATPLVTPLKDADLSALGKLPAALATTDADELALDARMEKAEKRQTAKAGAK